VCLRVVFPFSNRDVVGNIASNHVSDQATDVVYTVRMFAQGCLSTADVCKLLFLLLFNSDVNFGCELIAVCCANSFSLPCK
jgi:hypothetical protein